MAKESELLAEEAEVKRRLDPELRAIGSIIRTLEEAQSEGADRERIIAYLTVRYCREKEGDKKVPI